MTIFTCANNFISIMTCIYEAWASKLGADNIELQLEENVEPSLFNSYIHVDANEEKAESVVRTIHQKLDFECYHFIYYASCSEAPDKADLIYRFLRYAFYYGPCARNMLQNPVILRIMELNRKVSNEAHLSKEFTRFNAVCRDNQIIYVAHFEPKADVLLMIAPYFQDRMPSEYWIIVDAVRNIAAVHPTNSDYYLRVLEPQEAEELKEAANSDDEFTALWKTYFNAIAIKERENYICQRGHFPLWMRKHVTEFL